MVDREQAAPDADAWRVVVITNIPGGLVYQAVESIIRPLGHKGVGILTAPGPKRRRSSDYLGVVQAASPNVDVIVSNHPSRWAAFLAPLRPDLIICGGMPWLIPNDVLALPRLGAINMHPALLPKYRGPSSVEWAFRNGEAEMGFTVHRIDSDFDTGPILAQAPIPIDDDDDIDSLFVKFGQTVPQLLARAIDKVAVGDPGTPQNEADASYAPLFEPEFRTIDWNKPARTIHNQIRSWAGFRGSPRGALAEIDGQMINIIRSRLIPIEDGFNRDAKPGAVLTRADDRLVVQCADVPLEAIAWSVVVNGTGDAFDE